jgi:hypothetical protein
MPYVWLHHLRRAVAYARQAPQEFAPLAEQAHPMQDARLREEVYVIMKSHLICHSDASGFYVPVEFRGEPLYDPHLEGLRLGSSQTALAELTQTAPLLGIDLIDGGPTKTSIDSIREEGERKHPLWIERKVWLSLYEKFRLSVEHGTAVVFG